jgi:plasmid stabilization system protein ParE
LKPHIFHPEAADEYVQAVEYYSGITSELGAHFYQEIQRVIEQVSRQPERFLRVSSRARRGLARSFPYSVVYVDLPESIWIVAVMHAKRRPGYWRKRI